MIKRVIIGSFTIVFGFTGCAELSDMASKLNIKRKSNGSPTKTSTHQIWQGEYICKQGKTNIKVDVNTHNRTATMRFWNKEGVSEAEKFDGVIYGKVSLNDGIWFYPNSNSIDAWNVKPQGNVVFQSIKWRTRYVNNFKLDGTVDSRGCSSIELARID